MKEDGGDSCPSSPADLNALEGSRGNRKGRFTLDDAAETESDDPEATTEVSMLIQHLANFLKRFPAKKAENILSPDTSTSALSLVDSGKQRASQSLRVSYLDVIKQPMSVNLLKKRLESGDVSTSVEFKRDFTLMVANALMFHDSESEVGTTAKVSNWILGY